MDRNIGADSPSRTLPSSMVALSRTTLPPTLILVIGISFDGSRFLTASIKPKAHSAARNQTHGFSTALKSWDPGSKLHDERTCRSRLTAALFSTRSRTLIAQTVAGRHHESAAGQQACCRYR